MDKKDFFISERNLIIKQALEAFLDSKFAGIIYGKPLTGKTYFVKTLLDNNYINYHYIDLQKDNLDKELNDLIIDDYTVLVIDNAQLLSKDDLEKIIDIYKKFENLSLILIGNTELKDKITQAEFKEYLKNFNFIFEFKELNFKEFKDFLKSYMSEKGINIIFTKGALKDLYKKSEGKIGKVIYLLYKLKNRKFVYKFRKSLLFIPVLIIIALTTFYYISQNTTLKEEKKPIKTTSKLESNKTKVNESIKHGYLYDNKNMLCYNFLDYSKYSLNNLKEKKNTISLQVNKTEKSVEPLKTKYVYLINLGAFRYKENAKKLASILKESFNLTPEIKEDKQKKLFKVRLKYYDENKAKEVLNLVKQNPYFKNAFLRRVKNE